jgi:hypothetical protein
MAPHTVIEITNAQIHPEIMIHRTWGEAEKLFAALLATNPRLLTSFHPYWKEIDDKWICEECLQRAERQGICVPRPSTYLVEKHRIVHDLKRIGRAVQLIFKPAGGACCRGIFITSPTTFDAAVHQLPTVDNEKFVIQELIQNPVLFKGQRFDIRLFAVLWGINPLQWTLAPEGVVRLAARSYDTNYPTDPDALLTGLSYRVAKGLSDENTTVNRLLAYLNDEGYSVATFWDKLESLCSQVFEAIQTYPPIQQSQNLNRRFYLAGLDVMIVTQGQELYPLLEAVS